MSDIKFSIIVPVYSRPDEMDELLCSLECQEDKDFEVIVMEEPSQNQCGSVCLKYRERGLDVKHFTLHTGRSERRNEGMRRAGGNYFLLFDSDCILPPHYIKTVRRALTDSYVDCFGGPDAADGTFSDIQMAVNYSMTSFMTTGGIRGGMKNVDKFLPRAFNMGFSREVFAKTEGYREMIGEDIDLSLRIKEAGFSVRLIKEAFVYHKRRLDLRKFYRQVNTFGKARVLLARLHPGSLKVAHLFPACFAVGNMLLVLLAAFTCQWLWLLPLIVYAVAIFTESYVKNRRFRVAALSVLTSYAQMFGYGLGFMDELFTHKASKVAAEQMYRQ